MSANLQPTVIKSQQLISVIKNITIGCMADNSQKQEFAARLNELCDDHEIPPKGKNRQSLVGKKFGASQEAARKWLEGESIPQYEKLLEICKKWDVNIEWLFRGVGDKRHSYGLPEHSPEAHVVKAMQDMSEAEKYQLIKISAALAKPPDKNGTN